MTSNWETERSRLESPGHLFFLRISFDKAPVPKWRCDHCPATCYKTPRRERKKSRSVLEISGGSREVDARSGGDALECSCVAIFHLYFM